MTTFLSRWRPHHLFATWIGYWAVLASVALGPALMTHLRILRQPHGEENISATVQDAVVHLTVTQGGLPAWSGSVSVTALVLWLVGPPLLLWLAWITSRPTVTGVGRQPEPRHATRPSS